ncbi:hypothetical protein BZG17_31685, partial [Escherichia coli]|nr:hypothetical protein [Escherichia coli]
MLADAQAAVVGAHGHAAQFHRVHRGRRRHDGVVHQAGGNQGALVAHGHQEAEAIELLMPALVDHGVEGRQFIALGWQNA